ncbi:hypothetical protein PAXINDRAFT_98929 [Paxillus involutus ATCC 200175]|nr:hypothetical protein PAXINDRAFT_98929 [Paxillus involutus ATCC 200175]
MMSLLPIASDGQECFYPNEHSGSTHNPQESISPVRRLPTEILQQVFVECTEITPLGVTQSLDADIFFPQPDPSQAPLLLTQVCRLWRAISSSTPELWSSIRVSRHAYRAKSPRNLRLLRVMLEAWLSNAQSLPLKLHLEADVRWIKVGEAGSTTELVPPPLCNDILLVFTSHAFHWSTVIAPPVLTRYLFNLGIETPMLKTFSSQTWNLFSLDVFRSAPELSCLRLNNIRAQSLSLDGVAKGLRYLSLACCFHPSDLFDILAYFPELVSLHLGMSYGRFNGRLTKQLTHQKLLKFVASDGLVIPEVLDMLSFPSLRTLVVVGNWRVRHVQSVAAMLSRSSCSLRYLEFYGTDVGFIKDHVKREVEQLLQFTPCVRVHQLDFRRPAPSVK